jgi:hypothetical protein
MDFGRKAAKRKNNAIYNCALLASAAVNFSSQKTPPVRRISGERMFVDPQKASLQRGRKFCYPFPGRQCTTGCSDLQ